MKKRNRKKFTKKNLRVYWMVLDSPESIVHKAKRYWKPWDSHSGASHLKCRFILFRFYLFVAIFSVSFSFSFFMLKSLIANEFYIQTQTNRSKLVGPFDVTDSLINYARILLFIEVWGWPTENIPMLASKMSVVSSLASMHTRFFRLASSPLYYCIVSLSRYIYRRKRSKQIEEQ